MSADFIKCSKYLQRFKASLHLLGTMALLGRLSRFVELYVGYQID